MAMHVWLCMCVSSTCAAFSAVTAAWQTSHMTISAPPSLCLAYTLSLLNCHLNYVLCTVAYLALALAL
jgi:hypothetical protein